MRIINKGKEPQSFTIHRLKSDSTYSGLKEKDKDDLRSSLVSEQRGLCCYCMGRIRCRVEEMKIEHWQSQKSYPDRQLDYHNLLGSCKGGEGLPNDQQFCDTRKGDGILKWNPADPTHHIENKIHYKSDGTIFSKDEEFDKQLNDILNLNLKYLKNNRKSMLDNVLKWWKFEKNKIHGPIPREKLEKKREKIIGGTGELRPYCQIAVYWLEIKIRSKE